MISPMVPKLKPNFEKVSAAVPFVPPSPTTVATAKLAIANAQVAKVVAKLKVQVPKPQQPKPHQPKPQQPKPQQCKRPPSAPAASVQRTKKSKPVDPGGASDSSDSGSDSDEEMSLQELLQQKKLQMQKKRQQDQPPQNMSQAQKKLCTPNAKGDTNTKGHMSAEAATAAVPQSKLVARARVIGTGGQEQGRHELRDGEQTKASPEIVRTDRLRSVSPLPLLGL